ncbi:PREDICTED: protein EVI2B [Calidris pugnax]|uniref:protein EVI2B n=1 Tax=Calidris pugnax TaxID=198806 RepID=UPI00071DF8F3|nr:PREDICTED: protein EVI2B [Calidris pugnax]
MANKHLRRREPLLEVWKSLSTAAPPNASMNSRKANTRMRVPRAEKALPAAGLPQHKPGGALVVTAPPELPKTHTEPSDGSWIAALIIGIILISMIMAIVVILLWKCRKRPVVDSNWAGRSPFADGDTPDAFMDSDQAPKRSSVLFMLPWKWKADSAVQEDPTAPEQPSPCAASDDQGQLSPPGADGSVSGVSNPDTSPAPTTQAASAAEDSCPHPGASADPPDLPPPPDWLREPAGDQSPGGTKHQELSSGPEEPLPPPPESLIEEIEEPPAQLPQPQHPPEPAQADGQHASHLS